MRAHLCIVSNYFFAFLAGVGVQAVVAGDAVGIVLRQDVLASIQGLVAVFTVEPITHDDASSLSRPPAKKRNKKQMIQRRSLGFNISKNAAQEGGGEVRLGSHREKAGRRFSFFYIQWGNKGQQERANLLKNVRLQSEVKHYSGTSPCFSCYKHRMGWISTQLMLIYCNSLP